MGPNWFLRNLDLGTPSKVSGPTMAFMLEFILRVRFYKQIIIN